MGQAKIKELRRTSMNETTTITIRHALEAQPGLKNLLEQPLPAKDALGVARLIRAMNDRMAEFESVRTSIIQRLGYVDPQNPGMYKFPADKVAEWQQAELDLLNQTIELPKARVRLSDLGNVTPQTLLSADWLIEIDEAEETPSEHITTVE